MNFRKIILFAVMSFVLAVLLVSCGEIKCGDYPTKESIPDVTGELAVKFLKIGQADSIILKTGNHTAVIDCGEKNDGDKIIEALKKMGISKIDYLFITHFDKDHVGGAPELFGYIVPDNIIEANYTGTGKAYINYAEYTEKNNIKRNALKDKMSITLDDVLLNIYPSLKDEYSDANDNNHSIVITAKHGENTLLFTGDAEEDRLKELSGQIGDLRCSLVKMPHHGRFNSYTKAFLDLTKPKFAVITSSEKNPAEQKTLRALEDIKCKIYQTADGNVKAVSDGKSLNVDFEV